MATRVLVFLGFLVSYHNIVTVTVVGETLNELTKRRTSKKYKEKRRANDLALVQVWVPQDRIVEIKSIAVGMAEEVSSDLD